MDVELRSLRGVAVDALTRLAESMFGRGDRAPGWFARKLVREAVDLDLSVLAVAAGAPEHVPEDMLYGYFLIGQEPDDRVAHSAGLGVIAARRCGGLGGRMIAAAGERLRRSGHDVLRVLVEPALEPFYRRHRLRVVARRLTLLTHGAAAIRSERYDRELREHPPREWSPDPTPADALEVCAWRAGVWARTSSLAATLELSPGAWAHVSREGRALLVQRLVVAAGEDPQAAIAALVARTPATMPLLLYGVDPVSSITAALLREGGDVEASSPACAERRRGFHVAQRFAVMELQPGRRLDNACGGDG